MYLTRREFINSGTAAGLTYFGTGTLSPRLQRADAQAGASVVRPAGFERPLDLDLVAAEGWVDLAGDRARLWSYNGHVPGPLLEVVPGDDVRIRLLNQLDEPTNLHFHGLHVAPDGTADNIFREVAPGETASYAFRVPVDHRAGLFWVHPHVHGAVARQVSLGLAAPLIVRGALDAVPEVAAAAEHVCVLQDFELDRAGRPIDPGMAALMAGREGSLVTVSGQLRPRFAIEQDGALRLRFLNASPSRFYRLALERHAMHVIATDGGGLAVPQRVDDLLLAPGERRDVLILGDQDRGVYRLMSLHYSRGSASMMGGTLGTSTPFEVASVGYEGRADSPRTVPNTLVAVDRLPAASARRTFVLSEAMGMVRGRGMGMRFLINGREFEHVRIDDHVRLGDVEEWEYVNTTDMDHPMHVHTNAFQRVGVDGQSEPAWLDGIVVPARGRTRIRIRCTDFTGATVQHCHILDHEDLGMMATMQLEP